MSTKGRSSPSGASRSSRTTRWKACVSASRRRSTAYSPRSCGSSRDGPFRCRCERAPQCLGQERTRRIRPRAQWPCRHDVRDRRHLAAVAFGHTAAYDAAIGEHLRGPNAATTLPQDFTLGGHKVRDLRYGENPHQSAALYRTAAGGGIAGARQWQGLELSYNNLLDAQAAWSLVADFPDVAVAIIKHANPCGVARGKDAAEAFDRALNCDRRSAFGGIVAFNRPVDAAVAQALVGSFFEVVVGPTFDEAALDALTSRPELRVLQPGPGPAQLDLDARPITGGFLVQTADQDRKSVV